MFVPPRNGEQRVLECLHERETQMEAVGTAYASKRQGCKDDASLSPSSAFASKSLTSGVGEGTASAASAKSRGAMYARRWKKIILFEFTN